MSIPITTGEFNATANDFMTSNGGDVPVISMLEILTGPISNPGAKMNVGYSGSMSVTYDYDVVTSPPTTVPEPTVASLLLVGLAGLFVIDRKRGRQV